MTFQAFDTFPNTTSRRLGTSFILLALFAGVLGGSMALPVFHIHPTAGQSLCHGVLMTFFVICPAALGGFGQWLLPKALGTNKTSLPAASLAGFGFFACGVVLLPIFPAVGLLMWALGVLSVAVDIVATILEERRISFRDASPLVWSFLATASGAVVTAAVLAALVTKGLYRDDVVGPNDRLVTLLHLPETALMLTPALGLVAAILLRRPVAGSLTWWVAPYVFGTIGLVGPLFWADSLFGGTPNSMLPAIALLSQALPCAMLLAALCRDMWVERVELDGVTPWAFGALALFASGWASMLFPGQDIAHSAAAFGSIMALCGGFYAWLSYQLPSVSLPRVGKLHALLTLAGSICSVVPALAEVGGLIMGLSLIGFAVLGVTLMKEAGRVRVSS
ncbi:hypothetical protein WH240_06270 [Gluconobacter wancherniae]|uniref:hypothetical protein n=1 Tax=Gluconobacter wancherniae TaxID=1307955 RepID=UPI0030A8EED3